MTEDQRELLEAAQESLAAYSRNTFIVRGRI
jgi:hypothetical protein